ncbi:MAG: hypothetical protein HOV80_23780 [Polyangiaceae bacterium]|nr:hypothetical protein [Polyangiaceae bacterium]
MDSSPPPLHFVEGGSLVLLATALLLAPFVATAQPAPTGSTTAAAATTPPASLPSFADGLPTDKESKKPTPEEWRDSPVVAPTRMGPRAKGCTVSRVREWIRVSCPDLVTASIGVLGGTATDYAFWIDPQKEGNDAKLPAGGEIQFPVRKGDRRVIQMLTFGTGYEGPLTQLPAIVVQAHWLDDATGPTLTDL